MPKIVDCRIAVIHKQFVSALSLLFLDDLFIYPFGCSRHSDSGHVYITFECLSTTGIFLLRPCPCRASPSVSLISTAFLLQYLLTTATYRRPPLSILPCRALSFVCGRLHSEPKSPSTLFRYVGLAPSRAVSDQIGILGSRCLSHRSIALSTANPSSSHRNLGAHQ